MRESRRDPVYLGYFAILAWALTGLSYVDMLKKRRVTKRTLKRAIRR